MSYEDGLPEGDVAGSFLGLGVEMVGPCVQLVALAGKVLGSVRCPLEAVLLDVCGRPRCGVELDCDEEAGLLQCFHCGVDDVRLWVLIAAAWNVPGADAPPPAPAVALQNLGGAVAAAGAVDQRAFLRMCG